MRTIPLTQGYVAKVDDADYERATAYKWHAEEMRNGVYAATSVKGKRVSLHHFVVGAVRQSDLVDHKNGDGLDCQRGNLRVATPSQNQWNRKRGANNKSGVKGVSWNSARRQWVAQICVNYKRIFIGRFDTLDVAVQAYREAAVKHHGEFARFE